MSTSKSYQQFLADAGFENRPPMLERGDELMYYDAEIELMNLILLSIPNEIYNSVDACTTAKEMWKRVKHLMKGTIQNHVDRETRFTNEFNQFVAEPREALQDDVQTNFEDPLASAMLLLARAITQNFSNPTNNHLRTSSNTRNQAIIQEDRLNVQSRNPGFNQPIINSADGPSYDSAFVSEVQSSSINENKEQMYPNHTKIINSTIGDDQIDSNIIFDEPNGHVNSGSVEKYTSVPNLYALEQLARNVYQEAKKQQFFAQKVQQQNVTLTIA
ncbi:hypothetical protein Tco_1122451 [Tanacetum coccineum]|uniref:Uncharacterized protein n=1 Tax=Tanacetum coccineum TaxID=301880 RepID=A0ABQ5J1M1_9ASTR